MSHAKRGCRVLICALGLLAVAPGAVTAQQTAPPPATSGGIDVESIRQVLESAGYFVGTPVTFDDQTLVIEAGADGGRIVRAFVYADVNAADTARRQAVARSEAASNGVDMGPQLLSGFGASTWRRNVALVQSNPETFAELMPAEVNCTDLAPPNRPDLSSAAYQVDPNLIALLDATTAIRER